MGKPCHKKRDLATFRDEVLIYASELLHFVDRHVHLVDGYEKPDPIGGELVEQRAHTGAPIALLRLHVLPFQAQELTKAQPP